MLKVLHIFVFIGFLLSSCSPAVESEVADQAEQAIVDLVESAAQTEKTKFLSVEDLQFKVKESVQEINRLDEQIDALLKEI